MEQKAILLVASIVLFGIGCTLADNWAVLVAGSMGWYNYRHQADVCHAYQILHQHGIPDSNIIVMMYDDLAENREYVKRRAQFDVSVVFVSEILPKALLLIILMETMYIMVYRMITTAKYDNSLVLLFSSVFFVGCNTKEFYEYFTRK